MAQELWVEKWRPKKVSDYVFRDDRQRKQVEKWIAEKSIPNLLLSGSQGLGKSSLINILLTQLEVERGDILYINASEENSIDVVRNKVLGFASTIPYGDFKVVVLEEADGMGGSSTGQQALKRIMEDYSDTCRFILTTNNPHKILPAIHSRCQSYDMKSLNREEFQWRLAFILSEEGVEADVDTLDSYIDATIPDLRKAINTIQLNVVDGKLLLPTSDSKATGEWMVKAIEMFKSGRITEGRTYLCENADYNDYPEIYRFLYNNLNLWGNTEQQREDSIIAIRDGLKWDGAVADREINLSATLIELKKIKNGSSS
jgi:replication factor C small subunit